MAVAAWRDWLREVSAEGNLGLDRPRGSEVSGAVSST